MTNIAIEAMAHVVRWFTYYFDGDFPVRKLLVYQRVSIIITINHHPIPSFPTKHQQDQGNQSLKFC